MAVFFRSNCFDFDQDPEKTIDFLSRLPMESFRYVRQIQFRFDETRVKHWIKLDYNNQWLKLVEYLKIHLNIPQSSIIVEAETYDLGSDLDRYNNYYRDSNPIYDVYCDITRSLRKLGGLGHIEFRLGWFAYLQPFMSRAVAGEGYEDVYPELEPFDGDRFDKIPHWFNMEDFTRDSKLKFNFP
ncbi:hypothetical protein GLAREA_03983 [Glarea lozoyensis ATCC 20868]|uniref:Uncharacterized protein n=1 Tax=Glarea lozoyensis (strain ATCC 20868 / MF5171) TaxID=1116229 RepID=S3DG77_GLAL2|nr:uncharacterized protein GLAREA_03983 [Glarea lozoyensis ATCC 20868]EPE31016.1 hypothetical protein GLAREA_03983 [Glarea lozoyensis ATCC 20868]